MSEAYSEKIFDIIPPSQEGKSKPKRERIAEEEKISKPKLKLRLLKVFLFIVVPLIGGAVAFYFIFQKAEVTVWLKTEEVNFKEIITNII